MKTQYVVLIPLLMVALVVPVEGALGELDVADLISGSDRIVVGTVEGRTSIEERILVHYVKGEPYYYSTIFTYFEVRLVEELKGTADQKVVLVRTWGGPHPDGLHYTTSPTTANIELGEDVLLFLYRGRSSAEFTSDIYDLTGAKFGKFRILGARGEEVLQSDGNNPRLQAEMVDGHLTLSHFRQTILDEVRKERGGKSREQAD